jgi:hypothetical protein
MSELIERVARALAAENESRVQGRPIDPDAMMTNGPGVGLKPKPYWRLYETAARAAIEAMREPTAEMVAAGHAAVNWDGDMTPARYTAMINVALAQPLESE